MYGVWHVQNQVHGLGMPDIYHGEHVEPASGVNYSPQSTPRHPDSASARPLGSREGLLLRLLVNTKLLCERLLAEIFKFGCLEALANHHAGLLLGNHLGELLACAVHHTLLQLRGRRAGVDVDNLCCASRIGVEAEAGVGLRQGACQLGGRNGGRGGGDAEGFVGEVEVLRTQCQYTCRHDAFGEIKIDGYSPVVPAIHHCLPSSTLPASPQDLLLW